jgi:hypothetical protein
LHRSTIQVDVHAIFVKVNLLDAIHYITVSEKERIIMDPITITIMVIQGFIAVASTTWAISQSLSKNSFTKKMD